MKHGRIRILAFLVALLLVSSLFPAAMADDKPEIKVWQRNSGKGGPVHDYLADFNANQDELTAVYEGYGENYANMLSMALASNDPPDIFEIQSTMPLITYAEAGHILPVDDIITEEFKAQFHPSSFAQKALYFDGKLYAVPLRIMHYKLLYNKDLFQQAGLDPNRPPQTLEELREYARILTEKGNGVSYGLGFYVNYGDIWLRYIDTIAVASGDTGVYGFDYKTGKFDFSSHKKFFDFWVDVYRDGSMFPGAVTLGVEQMRANFAQGNVAMMIDGNWMTTQYATNIPTEVNWEAAPLPLFEGTPRAKDYMTCDITFAIAANGKNVEQAKALYQNILEHQMDFRRYGEADTKTFTAANTPEAFDLLPKDKVFRALDEMNNVSNHAAFPVEPHKFLKLEGDNRNTVFNNEFALAIDGSSNIDAAIEDLNQRYNAALEKAVAEGAVTPEELAPEGFDYFTR